MAVSDRVMVSQSLNDLYKGIQVTMASSDRPTINQGPRDI